MSGNQPDPNPFSREGARPGDGLGSPPDRFDTWADGSTPMAQPPPQPQPGRSADQPDFPTAQPFPAAGSEPEVFPPQGYPPVGEAGSAPSAAGFPTYPHGAGTRSDYPGADPDSAEAYAAFEGYRTGTPQPGAPMQPYGSYPGSPIQAQPYSPYGPRPQKSPYAVPALILGIFGAMCGITGPAGLGLGIAAVKQIDANPQTYGGRGIAIAGIVTGAIGTLWILFWILIGVGGI